MLLPVPADGVLLSGQHKAWQVLKGIETLSSLEIEWPGNACVTLRVRGNMIKTFPNLERPGGDSGLGSHGDTTRADAGAQSPSAASGLSADRHMRKRHF